MADIDSLLFLIFRLGESWYAVEATSVHEIVSLPEIAHLDEVPSCIAGALNLRGQIVLVIDLLIKFGHPPMVYRMVDSIVVLEASGKLASVLITEPHVVAIGAADILPESEILPVSHQPSHLSFVRGLVKWGDQVAMRLNVANIVAFTQDLAGDLDESIGLSPNVGFPTTDESRSLLSQRAHQLAQAADEDSPAGLGAYAVVRLGDELFGIELCDIREFANFTDITPIPCCPPHIAGQLSCRGDLITAIEISSYVGVSIPKHRQNQKLVIMRDSAFAAGVLVDELLDILYLTEDKIHTESKQTSPTPLGLGRDHFRGTATYRSRTLTLIDLPLLLAHQSLQVNETPK